MRRPTDLSEREARRYRGGDPAKRAAVLFVAAAIVLTVALFGLITLLT
jgi:hypothetical protein